MNLLFTRGVARLRDRNSPTAERRTPISCTENELREAGGIALEHALASLRTCGNDIATTYSEQAACKPIAIAEAVMDLLNLTRDDVRQILRASEGIASTVGPRNMSHPLTNHLRSAEFWLLGLDSNQQPSG